MQQRCLGSTQARVSELGFGAWGIGNTSWIGASDKSSVEALVGARDAGVNFFDTALVYGRGHSERLLARVFGRSAEIWIASKVPPRNMRWPAPAGTPLKEAFPRAHVLESLDRTLRNLGRDRVDLYQFHVWRDEWAAEAEWQETVAQILDSGKARWVGISVNDHEPENGMAALETGLIRTIQVIYNVFDQSPEDRLFPYCLQKGIGVIARVPFDEGGLTGAVHPGSVFPQGDFRNRYFAGDRKRLVFERAQRIAAAAAVDLAQLPEIALRFCISHPAVSTVIPGMRTAGHLARNAASVDRGPLPAALLATLREHRWMRNFYASAESDPAGQGSADAGPVAQPLRGQGNGAAIAAGLPT